MRLFKFRLVGLKLNVGILLPAGHGVGRVGSPVLVVGRHRHGLPRWGKCSLEDERVGDDSELVPLWSSEAMPELESCCESNMYVFSGIERK